MHPLLRFTLDLFETHEPPTRPVRAPHGPADAAPACPPVAVQTPASFRHPRASHELRLGAALVAYEFKRASRRSIGFSVGPEGLAVRAPRWVALREVEAALQAKASWILRKLQESRERQHRLATQAIEWRDGARLPFLGQTLTLRLTSAPGLPAPAVHAQVLYLGLPQDASPGHVRDAAKAWLMREALQIFRQRLDHFAPLLGVQWKKLALSNAGTRWGSAKQDGSIRLNWRLVHYRMPVLDYVVAHELSHLRVMDHSPRFWDTVRSVVPDCAALRRQLKDELSPRWD